MKRPTKVYAMAEGMLYVFTRSNWKRYLNSVLTDADTRVSDYSGYLAHRVYDITKITEYDAHTWLLDEK
jgi:hypothetical protein